MKLIRVKICNYKQSEVIFEDIGVRVKHIKLIRALTNCGLKYAKDYVDKNIDIIACNHIFILTLEQFGRFMALSLILSIESKGNFYASNFPVVSVEEASVEQKVHDLSTMFIG